jgi:hypothetical protein
MWRIFSVFVVCLVCLFSIKAQTVIENESSIVLNEKTADVSLVIENRAIAFDSSISLELIDEKDIVRQTVTSRLQIKNGKETYQIALPLGDLMKTAENEIAWYRLRYRVGESRGIISLSTIIRDIFELRVIAAEDLFSGMTYRSRVRATNPFNNQTVEGVKVNAELELELKGEDDQKLKLKSAGITDKEGFAFLEFQIPPEASFDYHGEVKITGQKNGIVRQAEEDLRYAGDDTQFLMMTDKPIYQPEQTLSVRGILLKGTEGKVVVPDSELEFRIEDEDNTVLYREKVKTSAFGIASMVWKIPENAKLGDYRIRVKEENQEEGYYAGYQRIKISRYDLPNFAVTAKALKSYYLPDEKQAEIEVNADYLFGKPVTRGKVRIARENGREWSWSEQKYNIEEGESHEGKTDENGKFTAKFDVRKDHEELKDNDYRKFRDLNFTAYFTDLTTNKTEQRRFDVRITKEPIHVYFIGEDYHNHPDLPVNAYVSAFYADGSPCTSCDVELKGREENSKEKYTLLQKLKTNSFGAGRLNFRRPKFDDGDDDLEIELIAKDKNGLKGTLGGEDYDGYDDDIQFTDDTEAIQVHSEKTIFKAGEAVKVKLTSTKQTGLVYVDIVKDWSVVESRFVNLKDGQAELKIPYQPNFQGVLKISAFMEDGEDNDLITGGRGIIFPVQTNLKVEANFEKASYKPGEDAKLSFGVLDSVGKAIESALGVVVFDKAVEERARTDSDFNGMFYGFRGWLGYGDSFGGINVKDLNDLDPNKPISDEMQLVAEVMLYDETYFPNIFHSRNYETDAKSVYADYFKKQFDPVEKKLLHHYAYKNDEHPTDEASLQKIMSENGLTFDALRDPWEQKYKAVFEVEKSNDVLRIVSSGADKTFGTKDDFTVSSLSFLYFTPTAKAIDKAIKNFHLRAGNYIRDEKTLFQELGITELKDRFGRPYQLKFEVAGRFYQLLIRSFGQDGKDCNCTWNDDFNIYLNKQDYFAETETKILNALKNAKKTPTNETELKNLLKENALDLDQIRDGYGEKVYLVNREFSRYTDVVKEEIVSEFGKEGAPKRTVVIPITQGLISFSIRSKSADRKANTPDDFTLAEFNQIIWEQSKDDKKPVIKPISYVDGTGSISGVVTDLQGAAVPNATVTATNTETSNSRSTTTDADGKYLIANLTTGKYNVKITAVGFKDSLMQNVAVTGSSVAKVDMALSVGAVNEVVTVSSEAAKVETTNASVAVVSEKQIRDLPIIARNVKNNLVELASEENESSQKSTPRLREYFPETLLWSPELLTDKDGKATLNFKMADSITTWKLYTIASTKNGKIGVAEKEVQAFQPFFVDLDPPKFLTTGDEIYLPMQVRNYTQAKQKVEVSMAKSDWFSFLSPAQQNIEVDKNAAKNAVFGFKTLMPVKDGQQRVTAIAETDSDAIEKGVTVRPNGEEIVQTDSKLFTNSAQFDLSFPTNALPNTPKAELKIYPNLMAHVTESVEGLLQRPYGCGEQTISSTYPNLMILKFIKTENSLDKKARRNLQKGYERLLGYQIADGGFSYWGGKDSSDIALTAYALHFLNDAKAFIEVDDEIIKKATDYLIKQQRADGSFYKKYYWEKEEDKNRVKMFTTYVARTLALLRTETDALSKALNYLKSRNEEIDEPYSLALYALANFDDANTAEGEKTVVRLQNLAKSEGSSVYWNLESNTPFYGWGTAGRIETTALVIQALIKSRIENPKTTDLISKGTLFLLKNKDRYGVWYSTQTTINVLDTFLASLGEAKDHTISVTINGEKLKDFAISGDQIEPITIPLTDKLANASRLEIKTSDDSQVMAQIVKSHYVDWKDSVSTNRQVNDSRTIRLDYKCDKLNARIMETVSCSVEAERIGFRGYGMLLAEIGIPPGADVSRESLEKAFDADWSLSRYDILPDRIVVYLWARAGGSKFNFSFKPRYRIKAQTPASVVYDYYNEESRGVVSPLKFEVK